ncbi:MAG TPA: hypothetical protein VML54_15900 [Candidatus Limnocylindrales bacterium]|nr:hypothetical protein [Candidatus Limnocylindrales bacterium]
MTDHLLRLGSLAIALALAACSTPGDLRNGADAAGAREVAAAQVPPVPHLEYLKTL